MAASSLPWPYVLKAPHEARNLRSQGDVLSRSLCPFWIVHVQVPGPPSTPCSHSFTPAPSTHVDLFPSSSLRVGTEGVPPPRLSDSQGWQFVGGGGLRTELRRVDWAFPCKTSHHPDGARGGKRRGGRRLVDWPCLTRTSGNLRI